jgi:predicted HicB family RNase H-like nuclease
VSTTSTSLSDFTEQGALRQMVHRIKHAGYIARIEYDPQIGEFFGQVTNTPDVITFYGSSISESRLELANSIRAHIAFCKRRGISLTCR